MKTKISVSSVNKSLKQQGYGNYVGTTCIRKGGGTYITWKADNDVSVLQTPMYFCLVQVNGNQVYPCFYIAFVYGPPTLSDRHILWDWLVRMSSVLSDSAWLVIGDLNQVFSLEDKK